MYGIVLSAGLIFASISHAGIVPYQSRAEAFHAVPVCMGPVATDNIRVARFTGDGQIMLNGVGETEDFNVQTQIEPLDMKIRGQILYVLSSSKIQEWDLTTKSMLSETPTVDTDVLPGPGEHATAMDWHGTDLVISHGAMGYSIYDTVTHKIKDHVLVLQDQFPLVSQLTAVVVVDDQAIFTVDNLTLTYPWQKHAFFGFLVVDLTTGKVRRVLGPDIGTEMVVRAGDQLIVGYGMLPLHVFNLKDVLSSSEVHIKKIVMKYDNPGHPFGHAAFVDGKLLTCFQQRATQDQPARMIPMILDGSLFQP